AQQCQEERRELIFHGGALPSAGEPFRLLSCPRDGGVATAGAPAPGSAPGNDGGRHVVGGKMASRRPVARALRRVGASFRVRGWAWVLACFAILAGATASAEDVSWRAEGAPEAGEPRVAAELLFDVERAAADE